jgi:SSS family solute:Na+ symporter
MFFHTPVSRPLGLCKALFVVDSFLLDAPAGSFWNTMQFIDPNIVAMPLAFLIAVIVSGASVKYEESHLRACWRWL